MQNKLATWSTEDKERKFDRLLRLIADKDWLSEAARITLASSGARTPGVDGVDRRMLEMNLQHKLATIREELLAGSDRATGHADGHGADMGKRFPPGFLWLQTGP